MQQRLTEWVYDCNVFCQRYRRATIQSTLSISGSLPYQSLLILLFRVSSEIFDLLLFVSYFISQSKGIKLGVYVFDVCCVNENFLVRCQIPTTCYSTGITITTEKHWTLS